MNKKVFFSTLCGALLSSALVVGGSDYPRQVTSQTEIVALTGALKSSGLCIGAIEGCSDSNRPLVQAQVQELLQNKKKLWLCCKNPYKEGRAELWYKLTRKEDLGMITGWAFNDFATVAVFSLATTRF